MRTTARAPLHREFDGPARTHASLLRVFPDALKRSLSLLLGKLPDINPILFSRIWVDLHRGRIEGISSILLAAGDPVFLMRLCIPVVALKAGDLSEPTAIVVDRLPDLEKFTQPIRAGPTIPSPLNSMYMRRRSLDIPSSPLARSSAVERQRQRARDVAFGSRRTPARAHRCTPQFGGPLSHGWDASAGRIQLIAATLTRGAIVSAPDRARRCRDSVRAIRYFHFQ